MKISILLFILVLRQGAFSQEIPTATYTFENGTLKCGGVEVGATFYVTELDKTFTRADSGLNLIRSEAFDYSSVCTTGVTDMSSMFFGLQNFNQNISHWDTSSVETMSYMFASAAAFNQNLSNWNTLKVKDMDSMFETAVAFNHDISRWNTANVEIMTFMFFRAEKFNQDISKWNTSKVTDMSSMFNAAEAFNQNLSSWDTSSVATMFAMFRGATAFSRDISQWNTSSVVTMSSMFYDAIAFNSDISKWDTSSLTNLDSMFRNASIFNQDISNWTTSKVTNMQYVFYHASSFNRSIAKWDTSNVTEMNGMFMDAQSFNQDISNWSTSKVVSMTQMFSWAISFNQSISKWDTSRVVYMTRMFEGAILFNQHLSKWNTAKVGSMSRMFHRAEAFNQDISKWNTSSVENITYMFYMAYKFNQDLTGWCLPKIPNLPIAFAPSLNSSLLPPWGSRSMCMQSCELYYPCGRNNTCSNLLYDYNCTCSGWSDGKNCTSLDCKTAEVGITSTGRDGKSFTKTDISTINMFLQTGNFSALQSVCTSGLANMSRIFQNSTIFQYDIFAFDMKSVNVSEAFQEVHFPDDLFRMCLPLMNQSQYAEILALGNIQEGREWVFNKAADRSCDCLFYKPCQNGGECFDKKITDASAGESYSCVCTTGYTGQSCGVQKQENLERTVTIIFEGVQLVNSSFAVNDLRLLFAETFQVHPSQIQVTVFFPAQNNRRRDTLTANADINVEITTSTPVKDIAVQANSLPSLFANATVKIQENVMGDDSTPLGLIIGLSVGAVVVLAGLVAFYRHNAKQRAAGFSRLKTQS